MINNYLDIEAHGDVVVIWMDEASSRVNTLNQQAVSAFSTALDQLEQNNRARGAVLISRKADTFIAGADLNMLRSMESKEEVRALIAEGQRLLNRLARLRIPTVAALHGAAMGGGLEVALACDYRLATNHSKTKMALPEVQLGLLPGTGGTQRLPRLVGIPDALDMMLTGRTIYPRRARSMGLVDALVYKEGLLDAALQVATHLAEGSLKIDRDDAQGLGGRILESNPVSRRVIYQQAEAKTLQQTKGNYPAPPKIIDCVRIGMEKGMKAGLEAEEKHFADLVFTQESKALVALFFAKQEADKNPLKDQAREIRTIGVLGAGLMGAGIAEVSVAHGLDVLLKDMDLRHAAKGKKQVWQNATKKVEKRILTEFERDVQVERARPVADYEAFSEVDLVIEAVPENLDLKHSILQATEAAMQSKGIFASNTSSIPIAEIAEASAHPEQVVGMHYFSPVPQMPLVEIIKTEETADWVLATAYETALRQGKTVIVVNDGPGFYTTRILAVFMNEALLLLEEGADIAQVDAAMVQFGFPMGPYALFDLVGMDVAAKITEVMGRYFTGRDMAISSSARKLVDAGYTGQKSGIGFYHYEKGAPGKVQKKNVNETIYAYFGGPSRNKMDTTEIQHRLALMMVNEATYCLQEGILQSPRDGDLGAVFGLGFPPFRGGPFRYIDQETAPATAARLSRLMVQHGERFKPSALLQEHASNGASFFN